jgi:hypothetical protein
LALLPLLLITQQTKKGTSMDTIYNPSFNFTLDSFNRELTKTADVDIEDDPCTGCVPSGDCNKCPYFITRRPY